MRTSMKMQKNSIYILEREFHIVKRIFKNRIKIVFSFLLVVIACNISSKERPFHLLAKYSDLNFNHRNTILLNYKEEIAGMTKSQGVIEAVFKIDSLNSDSLKTELINHNYKKLPISEIDLGDGFHGNVMQSDSGFYRLNLLHGSVIDVLIIVNFTQQKIVFYKLVQE